MTEAGKNRVVAPPSPQATDDLVVEEYKACRELIRTNIDNIERTETYCVGAAAAVAVFCLSSTNAAVVRLTCWLPLLVSLVGLLRYVAFHGTIRILDDYLRDIEGRCPAIGWAIHYRSKRRFHTLNTARFTMWVALAVLALGFGYVVSRHGPYENAKPQSLIDAAKPAASGM